MTVTTTDAATVSPLDFQEALDLQAVELERTVSMLRSLSPEQWSAATDCPGWDVHHMYLHVLGACEGGASMRENLHQMRAARRLRKRNGGPLEAALSAVQVSERADITPQQLVERLDGVAPATIKGRRRTPSLMRRVSMGIDGPVVEKWTLGYLVGTIYLRDLWMHRVDASRATGSELLLITEHDGRIVTDVVAEWARRHGRPFDLELTGPAGGTFGSGDGGEAITMDAVDFCRLLAGRGEASGLLSEIVPF